MNDLVCRRVKARFWSMCENPTMAEYWQVGPVGVVSLQWLMLYRKWCDLQFIAFDPDRFVLIDRSTPFGNPYKIGVDGDRKEVLRKYADTQLSEPQFVEHVQSALGGKTLVCHCAPLPCHGLYLARIANPV